MTKDLSYLRGWQIDKQLVELGHRHINEAAIMTASDIVMLAEFDLSDAHLPYPYKDVTTKYWIEVLRPQMATQPTGHKKDQPQKPMQPTPLKSLQIS